MQPLVQQNAGRSERHPANGSILVLSDSRDLSDTIAAHLAPLACATCVLAQDNSTFVSLTAGHKKLAFILIVVALSQGCTEAQKMLARAGLASSTGSVPMLIISEQPFCADFAHNILHLPFPLRANILPPIVDYLLYAQHGPN
jgi:hypothetical protein